MNALHNEILTWVGDGSDGSTLIQIKDELFVESETIGTPFNARLDTENCTSDYYVQVSITELMGHLSFGVVSKEEFQSGWKCKGMFFNGNLTNGGAALQVDWGPRFAQGDSLGVCVSYGAAALRITYYKNGACLGTGFQLAGNATTYYPCVHVSGKCSLKVEIPEQLPSTVRQEGTPSGFFGDWKIDKAWDGEDPVVIPERRAMKLILAREKVGIRMGFRMGNSIGGVAKVLEETATNMTIETGSFAMTMMMPPPEYRPLENLIASKKITKMELTENTTLTLSGSDVKLELTRFSRTAEPLTHY